MAEAGLLEGGLTEAERRLLGARIGGTAQSESRPGSRPGGVLWGHSECNLKNDFRSQFEAEFNLDDVLDRTAEANLNAATESKGAIAC
jgi:hypothetical protein